MLAGIPGSAALRGVVARLRSLWRGVRDRDRIEADMSEEFRFHLEQRAEDLMRRGLAPQEAARRARLEFGHVEGHREDARASRGLGVLDQIGFSWLDVKLGVRMLVKYPGLSLVSVIGMAVAIALGAGGFGFIHALLDTTLPLSDGERVVAVQNNDVRRPGSPNRQALHDFLIWREELQAVRDLSAFMEDDRNLTIAGGDTQPIRVALMTASGFRVARAGPALGRPLLDSDEQDGAPPVIVIAHEEWQRRFRGDPHIIGRTVRVDTTVHTVVGVMPAGFRFPVNHRYWAPLAVAPAAREIGGGPAVMIFGRLAGGATLERAQAELTTIGRRMAAAYPQTHEHLRPRVLPYTHPFIGVESAARMWTIRAAQYVLSLLLVVVSVNVAILVYARTAARTGEIAVRTALGASRRRVVTQLFAEALVLSVLAASVGLAIAAFALAWIPELVGARADELPFWVELGLSRSLVAYVAGLAVLAAVIVGVVPALKTTGRAVQASLQQLSARSSRMQLGRTWTALIVLQVAVAVAILPYALYSAGQFVRQGSADASYPVEELVRASLTIERGESAASPGGADSDDAVAARFTASVAELIRRLETEPGIAAVTFGSSFPGSEEPVRFEVEGSGTRDWGWVNRVDVALFDVFAVPVLAGRPFTDADAARGSNAVIVDRVFAERVLGGSNVLGRRVRRLARRDDAPDWIAAGPWLEIVGVVPDFTAPPALEPLDPKLYQPLALADLTEDVQLAIRMRRGAAPGNVLSRVRELTASLGPALRLVELQTAADAERQRQQGLLSLALAIAAVTASVLLLSAAGIYAMMSFTVARRRREIGIRAALGAAPRRLLAAIFARAGAQLGIGVASGLALAAAAGWIAGGGLFTGSGALLLPLVAVLMMAIGLLAALGPARRGLAIQPTEALHDE